MKRSSDRLNRYLSHLRPDSVAFWLVCVAFALFGVAAISIGEAPRLRAVLAGADGVATIVGRDCGHGFFDYEFTPPAGRMVRARISASRAGVVCESLVVGGTIAVRYTRDGRPAHIVGPEPMTYVRRRILLMAGFGFVVVGMTAVVLMAFHEGPRRRTRAGRR
jgi:hypothetical protein